MKRHLLRDYYRLPVEVQLRIIPEVLTQASRRWVCIILLVIVTLGLDYVTGPAIRFPVFYLPPIVLAAWYDGFGKGLTVAFVMVLARFLMRFLWGFEPWPLTVSVLNLVSNGTGLLAMTWFIARAGRLGREVRLLKGILNACRYCDKVQHDDTEWEPWDDFLHDHSEALLSYRICPTCTARGLASIEKN